MNTRQTKSSRCLHPVCSDAVIERLLDAAFRELQHDTGPQDVEYRHSRKLLNEKFREILRKRQNERAVAEGGAPDAADSTA